MELEHVDEQRLLDKHGAPAEPIDASAAPTPGYRVEWKDRPFAIAFAINIGVVVGIALFFGLPNAFNFFFTIHEGTSHGLRMVAALLMTACVGGAVSVAWLHVLQRRAAEVINLTLQGSIVALLVASVIGFMDSGAGGRAVGFINLFLAASIWFYYASIRGSIAFAAANLAASSRILNMQFFNKFAFCQVAMYGKDFQTAGYDTMRVFRDRGWSAVLNDSLVSTVLGVGSLVVGAISGAIGSTWVYMTMECTADEFQKHPEQCETFNVVVLTFLSCGAIGYAMCALVSSVLESIVATIYVCFAEDPAALQQTHPEEHSRLVDSWRRLKPELLAFSAAHV
ncbi:hypothetical protein ATCC90586_000499 [Pythium insidiosum]|nr:hypothetical protein ATCC90586_000499 [Pythium insidiosum]